MSLRLDSGTLHAALAGYQQQLEHIENKMAEVRRLLRGGVAKSSGATGAAPAGRRTRKHRVSAEGRARIAAAQRARWAKAKRAQKKSGAL